MQSNVIIAFQTWFRPYFPGLILWVQKWEWTVGMLLQHRAVIDHTPSCFCFHTQTAIHHMEQAWDQCGIELPSIVLTNDGDTNEYSEFLTSWWRQKTLKCLCVWLAVAAQPEEVISSHVTLNTFIEPGNCSKHWEQRMGCISQVLNLFSGKSRMLCVCSLWVVLCTRRDCAL